MSMTTTAGLALATAAQAWRESDASATTSTSACARDDAEPLAKKERMIVYELLASFFDLLNFHGDQT